MASSSYICEASWEVCNKVGGIHTLITSKIPFIQKALKKQQAFSATDYLLIGPYLHQDTQQGFVSQPLPKSLAFLKKKLTQLSIEIHYGIWSPYNQPVLLVDFSNMYNQRDTILTTLWEQYGIDSLHAAHDTIEPLLWSWACAHVLETLSSHRSCKKVIAHAHEWLASGLILHPSLITSKKIKTIFTTHATVFGRAIGSSTTHLETLVKDQNIQELIYTHGVHTKHQLEQASLQHASYSSTVSQLTAHEIKLIHNIEVNGVLENGFNTQQVDHYASSSQAYDELTTFINAFCGLPPKSYDLLFTMGRFEFSNKGYDAIVDALAQLDNSLERPLCFFFFVPMAQHGLTYDYLKQFHNYQLTQRIDTTQYPLQQQSFCPYTLDQNNELLSYVQKRLNNTQNIRCILIPDYLDTPSSLFSSHLYAFIHHFQGGIFPSLYEPWGYTPVECASAGVPPLVSNQSGFGLFAQDNNLKGIHVMSASEDNYDERVNNIMAFIQTVLTYNTPKKKRRQQELIAQSLTHVSWKQLVKKYTRVYSTLLK